MRAQACLDMRHGNGRGEPGERCAERARRIPLDDEQIRWLAQQRREGSGYLANVRVRISPARTAKVQAGERGQPEIFRIEVWMLAGENQRGDDAARFHRMGEGRQFDRFGPGADHQPYVGKVQPSPYLGGGPYDVVMRSVARPGDNLCRLMPCWALQNVHSPG